MSSLTWRISAESAVFPGQHQTRSGIPSRVTAMPITTCGRSSRWSLDLPQVRNPAVRAPRPRGAGVPAGTAAAVLVAGNRVVGVLRHEVGGGGVEEQQVHLKAQQVTRPGRRPASPGSPRDLQQPVHRPVARVVAGLRQARDQDVLVDPAGGGQLRRRGQRPVRDQREQHPLGRGSSRRPLSRPRIALPMPSRSHSASSTQVPPSGLDSVNSSPSAARPRPARVQVPGDRRDQPLQRLAVRGVLPAEVVHDLHRRPLRFCGSHTLWASCR